MSFGCLGGDNERLSYYSDGPQLGSGVHQASPHRSAECHLPGKAWFCIQPHRLSPEPTCRLRLYQLPTLVASRQRLQEGGFREGHPLSHHFDGPQLGSGVHQGDLIDLLNAGCLSWRVQTGVRRVTTIADNITETDCPISTELKEQHNIFALISRTQRRRGSCIPSPTEADFHQAPRPPMSQQSLLTTRACLLSTKPQVPSNSLSDALVLEDDQSTQMTRQRLPTRAKLTSCSSEEALYHDFRQHQVHK